MVVTRPVLRVVARRRSRRRRCRRCTARSPRASPPWRPPRRRRCPRAAARRCRPGWRRGRPRTTAPPPPVMTGTFGQAAGHRPVAVGAAAGRAGCRERREARAGGHGTDEARRARIVRDRRRLMDDGTSGIIGPPHVERDLGAGRGRSDAGRWCRRRRARPGRPARPPGRAARAPGAARRARRPSTCRCTSPAQKPGRQRGRRGTGAARAGLPHAALVHPHPHVARRPSGATNSTLVPCSGSGLTTGRQVRSRASRSIGSGSATTVCGLPRSRRQRRAAARGRARWTSASKPSLVGDRLLGQPPRAEVDGDQVGRLEPDQLDAGPGRDGELVGRSPGPRAAGRRRRPGCRCRTSRPRCRRRCGSP